MQILSKQGTAFEQLGFSLHYYGWFKGSDWQIILKQLVMIYYARLNVVLFLAVNTLKCQYSIFTAFHKTPITEHSSKECLSVQAGS